MKTARFSRLGCGGFGLPARTTRAVIVTARAISARRLVHPEGAPAQHRAIQPGDGVARGLVGGHLDKAKTLLWPVPRSMTTVAWRPRHLAEEFCELVVRCE